MSRAGARLLLPFAAVLLVGCSADPADVRREQVAALTAAANARDADLVRSRADVLLETVAAQVADKQLATDKAERLTRLARAVRAGADVIDADLIERRRLDAEAAAEAARRQLEQERKKIEEERKKIEEERKKAEEERKKDQGDGGKDKDD